jgi:hypothetical protein
MTAAVEQPWLDDRRIARLLDLWRGSRPAAGILPGRQHVDPITLGPDLLPYVALVEVTHGGTRFRFRLVGGRLVVHAGLDLTGHYIEDLNPNADYNAYINGMYMQAAAARLPIYSETRYRAPSNRAGLTRRLLCPLSNDAGIVDMFIAAQTFRTDDGPGDAPTYTYAASFMPGITRLLADTD